MKYTENYENVTEEYKVIIDEERLKEIIKKLDEEFSVVVTTTNRVSGSTEEEAIQKINAYRASDIKVLKVYKPSELGEHYNFLNDFSKPQNVYECEYSYYQVSHLSYLLRSVLNAYHTNDDLTRTLNEIRDYGKVLQNVEPSKLTEEERDKYSRYCEVYNEILGLFNGKITRKTINYDEDLEQKVKKLFI